MSMGKGFVRKKWVGQGGSETGEELMITSRMQCPHEWSHEVVREDNVFTEISEVSLPGLQIKGSNN